MGWAKIDDQFYDHPKVQAAGNAGAGLYVKSLAYCCRHLTDGAIPAPWAQKEAAGDVGLVQVLLDTGLWSRPDETGPYLIPDFLDFNPSKEEVLKRRHRDSARKQDGEGEDSRGSPNGIRAESARNPGTGRGTGLGSGSQTTPNLEANRSPAEVLRLLGEIAEIRSLAFPQDRRVAKAIADHPEADAIRAARDARDWACEGAGRSADVRDVVDLFRRQLGFASSRKGNAGYSAAKRAEELLAKGAAIEAEATEIA